MKVVAIMHYQLHLKDKEQVAQFIYSVNNSVESTVKLAEMEGYEN